MKNSILPLIFALFFTGCSAPFLNFDKNSSLSLEDKSHSISLSKDMKEGKYVNFQDISIERYHSMNENNHKLFYEYVETSLDYELNFDDLYTVLYAFDSEKYEPVYQDVNMQFYQINIKKRGYINMIVYSNDTQYTSYIYGYSNDEFLKILNSFVKKDDKTNIKLKFEALTFDKDAKTLTSWDYIKIYLTPLIIPVRYKGML